MATDSLCLENLDEFVNDENKIVTCKWLSLTLKIHINQAKRLLYTFLQQERKKDKEVNATFFVAGVSKGDNGHCEHRCLVVAEEDLEATRSQLSTVTSCHVYSIQRANLKDSNSLYATDYEGVRDNHADCNKYSSVHCKKASVPRTAPSRPKASPDKTNTGGAGDRISKQEVQQQDSSTGGTTGSSAAAVSSKGKKEPKGSIATMFAQSSKNKDTAASKKTDTAAKDDMKENKPATKKGGVLDLFANAKPPANKNKATEEAKKEKPAAKVTKTEEKQASKAVEAKKPLSKKTRPKEDSDTDEQPEKKRRRRIKNDLFDSSSEEEMEILEESPVPSPAKEASPEPESPVPAKRTPDKRERERSPPRDEPPSNGDKQRRRRRKLVPKTYLDEDGFMVTEKVWESESTDASEVEEEVKKKAAPQKKPEPAPAKKTSPKKKASPAKGKQTSLMSFFKKK